MEKREDSWAIEVKCRLLVDCRNGRRWLSVGSNQLYALSWISLLPEVLMRKSVSHLLLSLVKRMSIKYSYLLKYYDWTPCSELPLSWRFWELFHETSLFPSTGSGWCTIRVCLGQSVFIETFPWWAQKGGSLLGLCEALGHTELVACKILESLDSDGPS